MSKAMGRGAGKLSGSEGAQPAGSEISHVAKMEGSTSKAAPLLRAIADALDAGERSLLWEVEEALQALADLTGDRAYSRAARSLNQLTGGRPPIDDSKAIAEAVFLFEQGEAPTLNRAFDRVARGRSSSNDRRSRRAVAERYRRKHAQMKKVSTQ